MFKSRASFIVNPNLSGEQSEEGFSFESEAVPGSFIKVSTTQDQRIIEISALPTTFLNSDLWAQQATWIFRFQSVHKLVLFFVTSFLSVDF